MAGNVVEGFSVSHAMILDGTTAAGAAEQGMLEDFYGVREGNMTVDEGQFDNTGDDTVLSSWFWFNFVNLSIRGGYLPFSMIARLSGETQTSSSAAAGFTYELPIWTQRSLNQPTRPVLIRMPSKDNDGKIRNLDIVLYKVQFAPMKFDGPNYKAGLIMDYGGRALVSDKKEDGTALTGDNRGIGRIISRPI